MALAKRIAALGTRMARGTQRSNECACVSHARTILARVGMDYTISIEISKPQNGGRFKLRGVCFHFPGIRRKQNS